MKNLIGLLLLVLANELAAQPLADEKDNIPTEIHASYNIVKAGLVIGTVDEQFTRSGNHYKIISTTASAGVIKIFVNDKFIATAEGSIIVNRLQPDSFTFARQSDAKKTIHAKFNWNSGKLLSTHDGSTEIFDLPMGTQDRLAAQYQFMFEPALDAEIKVITTQGKGAENYIYRKLADSVLSTAQGAVATLHYKRDVRADKSEVEMWLSKENHHLPVRILFTDSHGLTLQQDLTSLTTN